MTNRANTILRSSDYRSSVWAGGVTREVWIYPDSSSLSARNFSLRISSAVIDSTSSTFSDFSGYDRALLTLKGSLRICIHGAWQEVGTGAPVYFSGADEVTSHNSSGTVDFNVIYRPGTVECVTVEEAGAWLDGGDKLIFALEAQSLDGTDLQCYDALLTSEEIQLSGRAIVVRMLLP